MAAPSAQPEVAEPTDRRALRSRQSLMDALGKVLRKKDFNDISIQEIADEANLTRATFYLHYPDKDALLQAMTAVRFGESLRKRLDSSPDCAGGLRTIALGVCEYLSRATSCPSSLSKMSLERSVIPVIEGIIHDGLRKFHMASGIDPEIFATTVAWAIFGAATRWAKTPDRIPAEQMADIIDSLVNPLWQSITAGRAH
ncbi:transcriptional regulator [Terriglobus roseus DSM 18391]|uniref:Transcriptional regulator n=1 Tax=Terriglobus roseus (strain DSM 18391 / NRRL B-41598 / KBS 63) TaxID=926566 RepID=I3ZBB3_TERRK|nr:TetR/AcrR family transcriptional regulator [Terriglobus roseus]AFL86531.1 transcriptional regulator [Terriglobus roseus DSM 18391]